MATDYSTFINVLQANTGLNRDVITQWVSLEKGVNNNILGVTSGGHLVSYPNQTVAAQDTARLINSSSNYAGIRASYGKTSAQQALAIIKSPWHSSSATGYYQRGFASITGSSSLPSGGASTPITPTNSTTLTGLQQKLASLGINTDPSYKLTDTELLTYLKSTQPGLADGPAKAIVSALRGSTVSDLTSKGYTDQVNPALGPINLDIGSALMFVAVIFVGIAFLFLGGIIVLKRPKGAAS